MSRTGGEEGKGLANATPSRPRIAELDRRIAQHKAKKAG